MYDEIPNYFYDTDHTPWSVKECSPGDECESGTDEQPCPNPATIEMRSHHDDGSGFTIRCEACGLAYFKWLIGEGLKPD